MNIAWTRPAVRDLAGLRAYIAEFNPQAAASMASKILESVERLATFPASGRPGRMPYTRDLIVPSTPYYVAYRVNADVVEILRVIHAARRWPDG